MEWPLQTRSRRLAVAAVYNLALLLAAQSLARSQSTIAGGDVVSELRFPPRREYKHPDAVRERYDQVTDVTSLQLGVASGSPLGLLVLKPLLLLVFDATFNGARPGAAPDSIVVTSRLFRLEISADKAQKVQAEHLATGAPGPLLSLFVSDPAVSTSGQPWRASLRSTVTGSREVLRGDETGIHYQGQHWLAVAGNLLDYGKKPGERALAFYARGDSGHLSMSLLPVRVRDVLNGGLSIVITEDEHRLALPIGTFLQVATAPQQVRTRFGAVDFTIQSEDLDAIRDFASRLAPAGAQVTEVLLPGASHASPSTAPIGRSEIGGVVPAGTVIELGNTYYTCAKTLKPNGNHLTTVTKQVGEANAVLVPAGAIVTLVVRDVHTSDASLDSTRIALEVTALVFDGKSYSLNADVFDIPLARSAEANDVCIPKDSRIQIKLRGPLNLAAGAHDDAGKALLQARESERAEAEFRVAIRLQPDDPQYHFDLARSLCAQQNRLPEAIVATRDAIRLGPGDSTLAGQQYRDYLKRALQSVASC